MRGAALRAGGAFFGLFAIGVLWRTFAGFGSDIDELQVFQLAAGIAIAVFIGWVATILLRAPRALEGAVVVIVILLLVPVFATETPRWAGPTENMTLTPRQRQAFTYLRDSVSFEWPYVGFAPTYSGGYLAMRVLNRSPNADAAYKQLMRSGTAAGQLYGLLGVYRTDPVFFRRIAPSFAARHDLVGSSSGCVIRSDELGAMVPGIVDGNLPALYFQRAYDERAALIAEREYDFTSSRTVVSDPAGGM